MILRIMYWKAVVFAGLALLLSFADMAFILGNQDLQRQVTERQGVINVASRVAPLNQQLSQALFKISVDDKDSQVRDLLVSQGFVLPKEAPIVKEEK